MIEDFTERMNEIIDFYGCKSARPKKLLDWTGGFELTSKQLARFFFVDF